jgi:hypothetical protein
MLSDERKMEIYKDAYELALTLINSGAGGVEAVKGGIKQEASEIEVLLESYGDEIAELMIRQQAFRTALLERTQ